MPFSPLIIDFSIAKRSGLAIHSEPPASPSQWTPDTVKASNGDRLNKDVWEFGDVVAVEGSNRAELRLKPDAEQTDPKLKKYLQPGNQLTVKTHFGNDGSEDLKVNIVS